MQTRSIKVLWTFISTVSNLEIFKTKKLYLKALTFGGRKGNGLRHLWSCLLLHFYDLISSICSWTTDVAKCNLINCIRLNCDTYENCRFVNMYVLPSIIVSVTFQKWSSWQNVAIKPMNQQTIYMYRYDQNKWWIHTAITFHVQHFLLVNICDCSTFLCGPLVTAKQLTLFCNRRQHQHRMNDRWPNGGTQIFFEHVFAGLYWIAFEFLIR